MKSIRSGWRWLRELCFNVLGETAATGTMQGPTDEVYRQLDNIPSYECSAKAASRPMSDKEK
jgi:hypothetical protein